MTTIVRWIAIVYDSTELVFDTKEEALDNAWMNSADNVYCIVDKSNYDELQEKLKIAEASREAAWFHKDRESDKLQIAIEALNVANGEFIDQDLYPENRIAVKFVHEALERINAK